MKTIFAALLITTGLFAQAPAVKPVVATAAKAEVKPVAPAKKAVKTPKVKKASVKKEVAPKAEVKK